MHGHEPQGDGGRGRAGGRDRGRKGEIDRERVCSQRLPILSGHSEQK